MSNETSDDLPQAFVPFDYLDNETLIAFETFRRGARLDGDRQALLTYAAKITPVVGSEGLSVYDLALQQARAPEYQDPRAAKAAGYVIWLSRDGEKVQDISAYTPVEPPTPGVVRELQRRGRRQRSAPEQNWGGLPPGMAASAAAHISHRGSGAKKRIA
jgi:hypothetical protein